MASPPVHDDFEAFAQRERGGLVRFAWGMLSDAHEVELDAFAKLVGGRLVENVDGSWRIEAR